MVAQSVFIVSCSGPPSPFVLTVQAGHALTQLGLMAHLCGVLSFNAEAAAPARAAALSAITALCATQPQSQVNLFRYGGLNAVLTTLLQQHSRSGGELLAAVTLLARVLAPMPEVRAIVADVRGFEVLAQLHRDATAPALQSATVTAIAKLTFRCVPRHVAHEVFWL